MINPAPAVRAALEAVDGVNGGAVCFNAKKIAGLPSVSYSEASNLPVLADDGEYLSETVYSVDVWAATAAGTNALAAAADAAMAVAGFTRDFAADMPEPDGRCRRKAMGFRILV
jgi:hypothetical protein